MAQIAEPVWIEAELVLAIHDRQLAEHGGPIGVRDASALESALARARTQWAYSETDMCALVAAYAYGVARNGAPFTELPEAFKRLQQHLLRKPGGDREMVEILSLILQHDEQFVLTAVEMALQAGVPTKVHILNLLHRLVDGKARHLLVCQPV